MDGREGECFRVAWGGLGVVRGWSVLVLVGGCVVDVVDVVWYGMMVGHGLARYNTAQYGTLQHNTAQYSTTQHCTASIVY